MDTVFKILNVTKDSWLTPDQQKLKSNYYKRFISNSEDFNYKTDNPVIVDMFKRYQYYWRSVLIEKVDQKLADSLFIGEMLAFLQKEFKPKFSIGEIYSNYNNLFQDFYKSKGVYGVSPSKTGILFDLYLWSDEREVIYEIVLPETSVKVPVVFMQNFISNGWGFYTTFGKKYSAGWASPDKLYCVEKAYDLNSESFKVSYISHEGQHFADYKSFPKLKNQADLEYRAKLTELALAKTSVLSLIAKFVKNAKNDAKYAHAFANYILIKNLSKVLFNSDFVNDINRWKKIAPRKINNASIQLLKANTKALNKLGAKTVSAYLQ